MFHERAFPKNPHGTSPRADRQAYLDLHEEAKRRSFPEIDAYEKRMGFRVDSEWFEELALHTQVVIKKSKLNYQHGRILYSTFSNYLSNLNSSDPVTVFETGTALGFSAVCMAKALRDRDVSGKIVTLDIISHNDPMYWNCIDDHEGPKSRQQLLQPWSEELLRIVFIQGWTGKQMERTGLLRINFAYLDAQHTEEDVLKEYRYVRERQEAGDVIVFDDVTAGSFDGVVQAVENIEQEGLYSVDRLQPSENRGYAIARRK